MAAQMNTKRKHICINADSTNSFLLFPSQVDQHKNPLVDSSGNWPLRPSSWPLYLHPSQLHRRRHANSSPQELAQTYKPYQEPVPRPHWHPINGLGPSVANLRTFWCFQYPIRTILVPASKVSYPVHITHQFGVCQGYTPCICICIHTINPLISPFADSQTHGFFYPWSHSHYWNQHTHSTVVVLPCWAPNLNHDCSFTLPPQPKNGRRYDRKGLKCRDKNREINQQVMSWAKQTHHREINIIFYLLLTS